MISSQIYSIKKNLTRYLNVDFNMKAIELLTNTNEDGSLTINQTGLKGGIAVRVIILTEEEVADEKKYLEFISRNPALDFLNEPEEDVYTTKDGKPFQH